MGLEATYREHPAHGGVTRLAAQSIDAFPPMASYLRRLVFVQFALDLPQLSGPEQEAIIAFARERGPESMDSDPGNARLLMTVLPMMQGRFGLGL